MLDSLSFSPTFPMLSQALLRYPHCSFSTPYYMLTAGSSYYTEWRLNYVRIVAYSGLAGLVTIRATVCCAAYSVSTVVTTASLYTTWYSVVPLAVVTVRIVGFGVDIGLGLIFGYSL